MKKIQFFSALFFILSFTLTALANERYIYYYDNDLYTEVSCEKNSQYLKGAGLVNSGTYNDYEELIEAYVNAWQKNSSKKYYGRLNNAEINGKIFSYAVVVFENRNALVYVEERKANVAFSCGDKPQKVSKLKLFASMSLK